jgi:uncharacterized phage-associated protein
MARDVREIANFVLDLAWDSQRSVSNFELNKITFFLHAHYLVQYQVPLVSAKIEAWKHGPVFREIYHEFKKFGDQPIDARARRIDPDTGQHIVCEYLFSDQEAMFLKQVALDYLKLSFSALYAVAHEKGGPWDQVWNHESASNASMKISDALIEKWFSVAARQ